MLEDVTRNVDKDRAGPAGRRDVERLLHGAGDLVHVADKLVVLGDGDGDALDVRLLEAVAADERADHLARHADERHGVHEGVGNSGHQIRRAGTGRAVADARFARNSSVGVCGVGCALLVLHEVVPDRVFLRHNAFGDGANADTAVLQHVV